ncbi:hypothetical protein EG359_16790 [Chryseobacterium joostei]|uniref:Tetratricopeptide repeat protein n=1 Tax=Chryseobacterium joostei TaxID=112234 RepID=A0A1N7IAG6_9FLAO|nr:hypothetical protein [Chryseobacterium joostei]AZB01165.1 hypothetical protein EG359_16790 [Chryseobacterium joostei]SIS34068.1 hypothetical protein SAMN05421768_103553 [Chryseobacterium joostei]
MKKYILSLAVVSLFYTNSDACAWSDPDYEYFNLFTQSIIKDKSYLPFLHTYSSRFFGGYNPSLIPDDNVEAWKKFFNNQLTYAETQNLVYKLSMNDLNALKNGTPTQPLLQKLGTGFYQKYKEGIDYLIEAKYLEPYMSINYVETENSFYSYSRNESKKDATSLDYNKTIAALTSLYNAARNPEIKQRYGYQLVRLNHYTRNYDSAVQAFKTYIEPIKLKGTVYFMALDQLAGAQRGLEMNGDANWNFFQVFMNSKDRKESAFISMKLSDTASFSNIMKRANTNEEKNMAYFLLGYEDFNNPIPIMEKMFDINPDSEILKVMAVRSINELERSYLPTYYYTSSSLGKVSVHTGNTETKTSKDTPADKATTEVKEEKISFWQKIVRFFKNLFGGSSSDKTGDGKKADQSDDELLNNPNRIPFYTTGYEGYDQTTKDYLDDLEKFTAKTKEKSKDEYWQIADAYLKFLKKDYKESTEILNDIKTTNPEYLEEIKRMKVLNDIVSQPKVDAAYEDHLMKDYAEYFVEKEVKKDTANVNDYDYYGDVPSTADFLKDVMANRYFLQGEDGKSFLMNNKLSDLQYNPNSNLVKSVEEFYRKPNKSQFEQQIIAKNMDSVGNIDAFFNTIYGDRAMRLADFDKAKSYYEKAQKFAGIPRVNYDWTENNGQTITQKQYTPTEYNGFNNISNLVFGHNVWESFQSPDAESMKAENYADFPFIKNTMNKLELTDVLIQLKKIGTGNDEKAAKANQLIGNLLYNTSILGYYRQLFVMDIDNSNGGKYYFWNTNNSNPYKYYYKNFLDTSYIEPDNFDLAINYYQKALKLSNNKEEKARILFQMASAEQGKYYQYEAKAQKDFDYSDPKWSEKEDARQKEMDNLKNQKYRTYFAQLKTQYSDTEAAKNLMGSCSYFSYFMKR